MSPSIVELLPAIGFAMQVIALLLVFIWRVLPFIRSKLAKRGAIPGPAFWLPLIGETPQLMQSPVKYMWSRWLSYGGVFRTNLLGQQVYVVGAQEALRPVWSDEDAFEFYVPGRAFSLLITDVRHMREPHMHAFFRRKLSQALGPSAVGAALLPPLARVVGRHLDVWGQRGRVELMAACEELSMDVALEVVTGQPLPASPKDKALVRNLFRTVLNGLYGLPIVLPGTALYKALRARKRLMQMLWPLVEAEAAEVAARVRGEGEVAAAAADLSDGGAAPAAEADDGGEELFGEAAASVGGAGAGSAGKDQGRSGSRAAAEPVRMLEAQISSALAVSGDLSALLSPEQLFERALGTVVAVDETSRHLFFALIAATALAPEVRARLVEEQLQALRKHGDALSYSVLSDMPYLDAVIKETMRLLPVSLGGFRVAKRDVQIGGSGSVIPAGGVVFWSTHLMHVCDPVLLPRVPEPTRTRRGGSEAAVAPGGTAGGGGGGAAALLGTAEGRRTLTRGIVGPTGLPAHLDYQERFEEAFRPERWLSEETRPRQFGAFGGGGHMCLGRHVAMAEAKLLLAMLLRRFDFRVEDRGLLSKAGMFPGPSPKKGTDGLVLIPRPLEP